MSKKKLLVGLAFATVLSLTSTNVFAAVTTAVVTVTGATDVTITGFSTTNFTSVLLNGTVQTATSAITDMTLVDARGTGNGWSVNLTSTQFTSTGTDNTALKTLPASSLVLGKVSIVAGEGSTPVTNIFIGSGAIDKAGGVTILNTPINEGMGSYTISMAPMTLTLLSKDANANSYASTITMTLSQGPVS